MKVDASGVFLGCDIPHSVQSENNVAEGILNFLKFSDTGCANII